MTASKRKAANPSFRSAPGVPARRQIPYITRFPAPSIPIKA